MDQTFSSPYTLLWKKYRPAILKMMIDATQGPQTYQLFPHELRSITPKGKNTSFTLRAHQGKAVTKLKDSVIAQDLLFTLSTSKKATELLEQNTYEFTLNRDYALQVTLVQPEQSA